MIMALKHLQIVHQMESKDNPKLYLNHNLHKTKTQAFHLRLCHQLNLRKLHCKSGKAWDHSLQLLV
jgi:hypothetical protein